MKDILDKRRNTPSLTYTNEDDLKASSDWVGTLKFFSLYPYFLLFFIFPIIFVIKEYTFKGMFIIFISYILGCFLGKLIPLALFSGEKELIKKYLLLTEGLLSFAFLLLSFAIYRYEGILIVSILWFIIGALEGYHIYLENFFLKKVICFIPYKVKYLTDSKEAMIQSLFFFLLAFFIFVIMPAILGSLISFFDYSDKDFSIAISLGFGTFILFFILIYHLTLASLLPSSKKEIKSYKIAKLSFRKILSYLKYSYKNYTKELLEDPSLSVFSIASFLPLLSLNYIFLSTNNSIDYNYYPLINLVIASSIYLILRVVLFFYFQDIFSKIDLKILSSLSVFIFIIILSVYVYSYEFSTLNFGILSLFFISLRLLRDIIALSFFHKKKGEKIDVNSRNLAKAYNKMPIIELLISTMLALFYPLIGALGVYFICFLLLASFFIIPKNKKV